jgi:membrane protein YqaA with SNARE-associated domain
MRAFRDALMAWGPWGILVLAIVESAGIPNPGGTDFMLLAVTILRPADAALCAGLAVVGSLIGSLVFYHIVRKGGEKFLDRYTSSGRGLRFRVWFQRYGLVTVFISALLPIPILPLKVFSACAVALGVSRGRFLAVLAAGRVPRYAGLAFLGAELGDHSQDWIKSHTWHMGAVAIGLFVALYFLLRWTDRARVV